MQQEFSLIDHKTETNFPYEFDLHGTKDNLLTDMYSGYVGSSS